MGDTPEDEVAVLRERLHAARVSLSNAYDQRDALAKEAAAAERDPDKVVETQLLMALACAERAVLAAEAEMKDAENALAVVSDPRKDVR
jgi:hypothetical protein